MDLVVCAGKDSGCMERECNGGVRGRRNRI